MQQPKTDILAEPRMQRKFKETLCAAFNVPVQNYYELAWRLGSTVLTHAVRPLIRSMSPAYFQADDDCLRAIAECRRRREVLEEIRGFKSSYLRRGLWRYLGVGLSERRLLKLFDYVVSVNAGSPGGAVSVSTDKKMPTNPACSRS